MNFKASGQKPYNPESYSFDKKSGMTPAAQAMAKVITHYGFSTPIIEAARLSLGRMKAANLPTFGYYFTERSTFNHAGYKRCGPAADNVCHTEELPYVFHNFIEKVDDQSILLSGKQVTEQEYHLADRMNTSWANFAKEPLNWKQGWGYPPMQSAAKGPYVQWAAPVKIIDDLEQQVNYSFWLPIFEKNNRKYAHQ